MVDLKKMKESIKRVYEFIVRLAIAAPHKPFASYSMASNRVSTAHTIRLIKQLGIMPAHLVDVGANESQWSKWLIQEWPDLKVTSFEPLQKFHPIGDVQHLALSDSQSEMKMVSRNAYHIDDNGDTIVKAVRFDSLGLRIKKPAILKIDAENFTARALIGFGKRINEFDVVVVEMWNDFDSQAFKNQQAEIWEFMLLHGFRQCRMVDSLYSIHSISFYDMAFYK
jgi:FkbM family methyltransferase